MIGTVASRPEVERIVCPMAIICSDELRPTRWPCLRRAGGPSDSAAERIEGATISVSLTGGPEPVLGLAGCG